MLDRPGSGRGWRIVGLVATALVLSVFAWWPMLGAYPATQGGDGGFYHQMMEAARISVTRWHELPLWNPYQCGGVPLWDNPQGVAAAPLAWPMWILGTTRTIELWYVLHSAIGFLCMWALARHELRCSREASLVASAMWAFAGVHNQHFTGGHFTFVPWLYYPLAIVLWRRAERDARMAAALGALVALVIDEGGVYPLPHMALLLAAETLTRAWPPRRVAAIAKAGAIVFAVGFGLGAPRFLPVIDQLRSHVRPLGQETDQLHWATLRDMFLARAHDRYVPGQQYVWPEFADYVGPFLLALAIVGIPLAATEHAWLVALLVFAFALMVGHAGPYAPWSILKGHVFPFKQMRVPSRFNAMVTAILAPLAAIAIDRVTELARRHARDARIAEALRVAILALAFVGVGDMIGVGIDWCARCFDGAPQDPHVAVSTRLYYGGPNMPGFLDQPRANRARLECWDEWGFTAGAPLWTGDVPQARAVDDAATVEVANRTQNTFTIDVDARRPARILVNGAYDRGWRTNVGAVEDENKQLVVVLPPGRHHVVLRYWPHGLTVGLCLFALTSAGLIAFFVWDRRRRRAADGATETATEIAATP